LATPMLIGGDSADKVEAVELVHWRAINNC